MRSPYTPCYSLSNCMRFAVTLIVVLLISVRPSTATVGFQQIEIPDPSSTPLTIGIWYPSNSPASSQPIGPFRADVALNGAIDGAKFPVIFISHGTAGSLASHYDTALALAEVGFVVVAVTHTGRSEEHTSE